jgi:transcriptional regulator with XRE-family HTH domain
MPVSYAGRKVTASHKLHGKAFFATAQCAMLPYMGRKATYIRAWRKERGFSLDEVVGRLDALRVSITGASLSRIERGIQPYSQDFLEALADALDVTVAQLIEHDPTLPGAKVIDFLQHLSKRDAAQAEDVLRAMFKDMPG